MGMGRKGLECKPEVFPPIKSGNVHGESMISCARKQRCSKKRYENVKRTQKPAYGVPTGPIWENLNLKLNDDSSRFYSIE